MRRALTAAVSLAVLGFTSMGTAWAQTTPVSSFAQLAGLLQVGDRVYVTDTSGREHEGTLSELPASSIKLVIPGTLKEFAASEVAAITRLVPDSKTNGTIIGLVVGAGLGVAVGAYAAAESGTNSGSGAVVGAMAYGGLGALIGLGIDALNPWKKTLVYCARSTRPAVRLNVSPIVLPTRRAIVAQISF